MLFLRRLSNNVRRFSTKPYYVTTPIFYPNAAPHIGHLYTLVTADVIARFQRLRGRDVRFLAGTDEHGMKIQKAAVLWNEGQAGKEKEFCDSLSLRFKELGRTADITNTCFMRTTAKNHHETVKAVWERLAAQDLIYKTKYSGWYSITDECFYTESQVEKDPVTRNTVSVETGAVVEWSSEENYMFRLSAFRDALLQHYTSNPGAVYPSQYHSDVLQMLDPNVELGDLSISRPRSRLSWGIPVPGDPDHTVYVWFDALLIYLTGAGFPNAVDWPADLQVIGKDILRFHAVYLPAILLALNSSPGASPKLPLPKRLLTHAHWTVSQKKMSKSLGNVADPLQAIDTYGIDVVRFYLMRIGGRWKDDVDWSEVQVDKHAKEITSQLGNYFLRVSSPKIGARAERPAQDGWISQENAALESAAQALVPRVVEHMENLEAAQALEEIITVLKLANKVFTDLTPWSLNCSPELVYETRRVGLNALRVVGLCLQPFMPTISTKMLDALDVPPEARALDNRQVRVDADKVQCIKLF